jgi:predicted DNA-binding transcriptional regulator AlpA
MTGRPTSYKEEMIQEAQDYIEGGYKEQEDIIPSMIGLAKLLKVNKSTLYDWMSDKEHPFSDTLKLVATFQESALYNGGLKGDLNSAITKLALHNFGYSDKTQSDININPVDLSEKTEEDLLYFKEHGVFPTTTSR